MAGTTVLTPAPESAGSTVALVTVGERQAELSVARGDSLVLTSSLATGANLAGRSQAKLAHTQLVRT